VLPVTTTIGGAGTDFIFAGLTPGFVGLYQVNVVVKPGTPTGNSVPVVITAAGQSSKPAMISVR
jgi:adhesin/invasin